MAQWNSEDKLVDIVEVESEQPPQQYFLSQVPSVKDLEDVLSLEEKVPAVVLEVEASEIAFTKESSLLQLRGAC